MTRPLSPTTAAEPATGATASHQPPSLPLAPLIDDYLANLRHERGCAKTTQYHYASWLRAFLRYLDENGHEKTLASFNATVLRSYLYAMSRAGKRPRTILSSFNPIKGLGQFLTEHALLDHNPTKSLTYPKKDAAKRQTVSAAEIAALLDAVERLPNQKDVTLARALLSTLVYTGVRFDELRSIRVQDINMGNKTLLIARGKGNKSRELFPPSPCLEALSEWLKMRAKLFGGDCQHDWLWAYNSRQRIGEEGVRSLLQDVKAVAGLRDAAHIQPHALRHSFSTRMAQQGMPLTGVSACLGHSLLSTTFQYLHLGEDETKKMAEYALLRPDAKKVDTEPPTPPTAAKLHRAAFNRTRRQGVAR